MPTKNKQNLKVIVGLGKTGLSCLHYLLGQGEQVAAVDSRETPPTKEELTPFIKQGVKIVLGSFAPELLCVAQELIVSPGVSLQEPAIASAIARGIPAIGDIELFARAVNQNKMPVVAITGSNGKSTVTTLVGEMAKSAGIVTAVGGNLGTPVLDFLQPKEKNSALYVLELSSFQLETTHSLKPQAATILNVSEDHMDRYASFAEYVAAKQRIFQGAEWAIVNRDDNLSVQNVNLPTNIITFGLNKPERDQFGLVDGYLCFGAEKLLAASELKIKGRHQVANALASLALGKALNLPMAAMLKALVAFPGLPHRCQFVHTLNGVTFYNDSKGTNVGATLASINGLGSEIKGKLVLIAGGLGKGADFTPLQAVAAKYVKAVVLIGKDAKIIADALSGITETVFASSMEEAVSLAYAKAKPDDAVLLSPACSSLDMFTNFEQRGNVFAEFVTRNLI